MRHFLFEDKPYDIDIRFRAPRREKAASYGLDYLKRLLRGKHKGGAKQSTGRLRHNSVKDTRQMCVVKVQYSKKLAAHKKQINEYLTREGTDIDGGKAKLYGVDLAEYKKKMVAKNFRIFLSPQSDKIPLETLTRTFVKRLELVSGYKLYWLAANHYNTNHPHTHLLINGSDQNGKDVIIGADIIKKFMREDARDICTAIIGHRSFQEMEAERKNLVSVNRWTSLDETIKKSSGGTNTVVLGRNKEARERLMNRLDYLKSIGLCVFNKGDYKLNPKWEYILRGNARYNSYLASQKELKFTRAERLKIYEGADGNIAGKVTKVYAPTDDTSNNHVVLVEGIDGKAYFVPLLRKPFYSRTDNKNISVKSGDSIIIMPTKTQKGRLSPEFLNTSVSNLRQLVIKNDYKNPCADTLLKEYEARNNQLNGVKNKI